MNSTAEFENSQKLYWSIVLETTIKINLDPILIQVEHNKKKVEH